MSDKLREAASIGWDRPCFLCRSHPCDRSCPEQEQEPVVHPFEDAAVISALTWAAVFIRNKYPAGHNGADSWLMNYSDQFGEHIRRSDHREWEKVHGRWKPKAAPPRKEWVGLTAEDMADAHNSTSGDVMMRLAGFARAIEAMLRERNGG